MAPRMSAAEAAAALGVKRETLYAYVSRGMLTSRRNPDGRSSSFDREEVAALAARSRRGGRAASLEVVIASAITLIDNDHLYYRGLDVADLVPGTSLEQVAALLWTGALGPVGTTWPIAATQPPLPPMGGIDTLRAIVAWAGDQDELRYNLTPESVAAAGRRAITAMVDGLALNPAGELSLAARLTPRLGPPTPQLVEIVDTVLVLMADHELAASTFATRVAASVRADPYSVISTGLGVIAGALHGAASQPVVALLEEIGSPGRVGRVVGERLHRHERIAGLGHKVYRAVDPRAEVLLAMLPTVPFPAERWAVVEELMALLREQVPLLLNIDFALGALTWCAGLTDDAAELMFAVARSVGWIAHAIEEYGEPPLRFRPRAAYTGFSPQNEA
jgi:citrate synthase